MDIPNTIKSSPVQKFIPTGSESNRMESTVAINGFKRKMYDEAIAENRLSVLKKSIYPKPLKTIPI
jgi:hypothetical protein